MSEVPPYAGLARLGHRVNASIRFPQEHSPVIVLVMAQVR